MAQHPTALRGLGRVYRPTCRDPKTPKQKTSTVWWIEFWRDGRQHRESTKSRNVTDARTLLKRWLGEIANGSFAGRDGERTTFESLRQLIRDDYEKNGRDVKDLDTVLNRFGEALAGLRAVDITTGKISAYQAAQKRAGYANATINREIAALKRAFRLAHRAGRITTVPHLDILQEDNVRKGFFALSAEYTKQTVKERVADEAAVTACLGSNKYAAEISAEQLEGTNVGVVGTPTFVLGRTTGDSVEGLVLVGALSYATFDAAPKDLLDSNKWPSCTRSAQCYGALEASQGRSRR